MTTPCTHWNSGYALLRHGLSDVEGGYGQTIYKLHRHAVRTDLALGRILDHMGIPAPTEEEVDSTLDEA